MSSKKVIKISIIAEHQLMPGQLVTTKDIGRYLVIDVFENLPEFPFGEFVKYKIDMIDNWDNLNQITQQWTAIDNGWA